ncbi:pyridoxal phosphate-dependent aminotransferase [Streptomyces sp. NBC_01237]|uniref:pyridoxal phosphate-dependent aminotransferase n=1 Tax=Streptomyces sp. NBC_01237 TaxID=2903790 RepID=UPI002DD8C4DA|nr:pyridoxal phosphate-dependent aminotransferase [Streptomyces sp. NBC_01237]WRZ70437.1 pyridoxal phosphate-dependent aminotransferase [Streptomyces sp. NBC_01237]
MTTNPVSTGQSPSTSPAEAAALLARMPDLEQALAFYHRHVAPDTAIDLSVAENVLVYDDSMQKMVFANTSLLPEKYIHYFSPYGTPELRQQVADLLTEAFGRRVPADHVFGTAGVASALECLAFALKNSEPSGPPPLVDGDAVLIPAPYWQGFNWSFEQRPKLTCVPVHLPTEGPHAFQLTLDLIKEQYEEHKRRTGRAPRLLVLTNPHNPLGVNYSKKLLEEIYAWALGDPNLHIISDEIYCHSQLAGITTPFTSAVALDAYAEHPSRIHVVWGFAKDFGLSGFRTGFIVSQNAVVQDAMLGSTDTGAEKRHPMSWFTPVDSLKHYVVGAVLTASVNGPGSELYTTYAMRTYRDLLSASFDKVKARLEHHRIKYIHQDGDNAAQFFWLDLRDYLDLCVPPNQGDATPFPLTADDLDPREQCLFDYLRTAPTEVSLLPGGVMHSSEPGFFRLCFSARQPDEVCEAIDRVSKALALLKPQA